MEVPKESKNRNITGELTNGVSLGLKQAFDCFVQVPEKFQSCFKTLENGNKSKMLGHVWPANELSSWDANLTKQIQNWKENPTWADQPPEIKVSVPKGSLCNLSVKFHAGLPPDAIYNIVTDPDNKRVFKNIKEVISRKVLVDEGLRQVVDIEQATLWKFLWWSGTIPIHVIVDQNRGNHMVTFKQGKSGFMERFEGYWNIQPLFVDEKACSLGKPKTLAEYISCTEGKGRVGSIVSLEQLVQPSLVPPPPISWYLRGITSKTTEMLITDLQAEASRIRNNIEYIMVNQKILESDPKLDGRSEYYLDDVKKRWKYRKRRASHLQNVR